MSNDDAMKLLKGKVAELGQAATARQLGISPSALNQLLHGSYKAAPDAILQRVREIFGSETVNCPVLGEISLGRCAEERRKPFAAANHQAVAVWKACRRCEREGKQ